MRFTYEGFTQSGPNRLFHFRSAASGEPGKVFCIEVGLALFTQNHVAVQDGPAFCLRLLEAASTAGVSALERLHAYTAASEDFRPLVVERERKLAQRAIKVSMRKPVRKPSTGFNISLRNPEPG